MIICFTSLALWILAGISFQRLLKEDILPANRPRMIILPAAIVILLSCVFLFRPHEDIFGGEDPGSYLNSSVTYLRQGSLFYTDPLLSRIPVTNRTDFLYGDSKFGKTKDACLWVRDMDKATIGPWFLPAYPVMMSIVAWIEPQLVLYVVPLFALLTAIVLGVLAIRLSGQMAGAPIVFLLYLMNPVTAWNARCPRPEIIAGFFFFLGWALLAGAWKNRQRAAFFDIILAATCLSIAPFFHISAFFGTLPTLAVIAVLAIMGRKELFICLPIGLVGLLGFMYCTTEVTDPYLLGKYLTWFRPYPVQLITAIVAGLFLAYGLYIGRSLMPESAAPAETIAPRTFHLPLWLRIGLMLLVLGSVVLIYFFRPASGHLAFLPQKGAFLTLTDFKGVVSLVSRSQAIAALLGLAILIMRQDFATTARLLLLVTLLPGLFFAGCMSNYMMETRRLMLFVVPLISLSIGALLLSLGAHSGRWRPVVITGCTCLMLMAAFRGRSQLYTSVDYAGFYNFLKPIAGSITQRDGVLLAEYSRIAAPFEHLFGIRTLSLDNDTRSNHQAAEHAWKTFVMEKEPGLKAFFLTPFQPPISEMFDFIPLQATTYTGGRMPAQHEKIPRPRNYGLQLRLYEMRLTNGQSDASSFFTNGMYCREFDQGNMGLRRFANLQTRPWSAKGHRLSKEQNLELSIDQRSNGEPAKELLLFLYAQGKETPPDWTGVTVNFAKGGKANVKCRNLDNSWWVARAAIPADNAECRFTVASDQPALLCQAKVRTLNTIRDIEIPGDVFEKEQMAPFYARWARNKAQFLVPVDRNEPVELFLFLKGTEISQGHQLAVRGPSGDSKMLEMTPDNWRWQVLTIASDPEKHDRGWVTITTDEPWNPKLVNYPPDLAVLVGRIVAVHP